MKRVNIKEFPIELVQVLELAHEGPVVLLGPNGKEYVLAEADDFDQEVEQLRQSVEFQKFLDERTAKQRPRRLLRDVARAIEEEIASSQEPE